MHRLTREEGREKKNDVKKDKSKTPDPSLDTKVTKVWFCSCSPETEGGVPSRDVEYVVGEGTDPVIKCRGLCCDLEVAIEVQELVMEVCTECVDGVCVIDDLAVSKGCVVNSKVMIEITDVTPGLGPVDIQDTLPEKPPDKTEEHPSSPKPPSRPPSGKNSRPNSRGSNSDKKNGSRPGSAAADKAVVDAEQVQLMKLKMQEEDYARALAEQVEFNERMTRPPKLPIYGMAPVNLERLASTKIKLIILDPAVREAAQAKRQKAQKGGSKLKK